MAPNADTIGQRASSTTKRKTRPSDKAKYGIYHNEPINLKPGSSGRKKLYGKELKKPSLAKQINQTKAKELARSAKQNKKPAKRTSTGYSTRTNYNSSSGTRKSASRRSPNKKTNEAIKPASSHFGTVLLFLSQALQGLRSVVWDSTDINDAEKLVKKISSEMKNNGKDLVHS